MNAGTPEGESHPVLAGEPQVIRRLGLQVLQHISRIVLAYRDRQKYLLDPWEFVIGVWLKY